MLDASETHDDEDDDDDDHDDDDDEFEEAQREFSTPAASLLGDHEDTMLGEGSTQDVSRRTVPQSHEALPPVMQQQRCTL
jgi:hypothetical protein